MPSRSTLQSYTGAFLHSAGANSSCIADQVAQYLLFCQQQKAQGRKEPKGDGALIFDEVKVISRLMWNSRSQTLIGLSMDHDELSSLSDIYSCADGKCPEQTSYILQFLWRDLTSHFDIVGPFFTSSSTMESKFIVSCILETLKLLYMHGMKVSVLVCDGASANLTTIEATNSHFGVMRLTKVYMYKELYIKLHMIFFIDQADPYEVQP